MVKCILSSVLLAACLLVSTNAYASLDELTKAWQAMRPLKEGIHTTQAGVFSVAQRVVNPGEETKRVLILTDHIAIEQLARAVLADGQEDMSLQAILTRHFLSRTVSLPGHVFLSECDKGLCRSVYAMTNEEWAKAKTSISNEKNPASLEAFKSSPFTSSALLKELGMPDLALLVEMRRTPVLYANVRSSALPTSSVMKKALAFEEKRNTGVRALIEAGAGSDLALQAIFAVESPPSFAEQLVKADIPSLAWHPETSTLRQIANVQGFVCLDGRAKNAPPASMDFIRQCFAEGRDLALAIELLESAAERATATPEVWEYLAAAYLAADRPAPAQIAARVWFVTAKDPTEAGLWILKKFHSSPRSEEIRSLLER